MNKPRDGNIPTFHYPHSERDGPDSQHPLAHKMESGLAEPRRDTRRNRDLARQRGWSEEDWDRWVTFGLTPGQQAPEEPEIQKSSIQRITDEIDERVGKRMKEG